MLTPGGRASGSFVASSSASLPWSLSFDSVDMKERQVAGLAEGLKVRGV